MVKIICPNRECDKIIVEGETMEELTKIVKEKYIQCPYCGRIYENPLKNDKI